LEIQFTKCYRPTRGQARSLFSVAPLLLMIKLIKILYLHTCQPKSVYNCKRGGTAILTNAVLEKMRNNMENLSNTKVSNVTKGCLKKLAHAKNEMRAQKK